MGNRRISPTRALLQRAGDRLRGLRLPRLRLPALRLPPLRLPWQKAPSVLTAAPPEGAPRGLDLVLLGAALLLVCFGAVMVYSSSALFASANYGNGTYFLRRHLIYAFAGLVALYAGWRIDYRRYARWVYPILGLSLLSLLLVVIPGIGTRVDGAVRWFRLGGISVQPSEPAKIALVIYLAYSLAKKRATMRIFSVGFLPHLCVAGMMALLILKQPDLGSAGILVLVTLLLLFVAGTKLSYLLISLLVCAPVVYQLIVGTPWRMRRLLAFLDPWAYRQDAGYQVSESLISVGSGGLFGLGLGDGKQKLFFLPAAHTDFIFAITGEELGLLGVLGVILAFLVILWRGVRAAVGAADLFGTYLAFGITAIFSLQALLHMTVVLGMVPTKGITLPLVSYGGSALVVAMYGMGILLNVAARHPAPVAEPSPAQPSSARGSSNRRRPQRVVVADGG
ncbi:MAG: putative lipid II flippase FtsW [Deltaproteobacteria bacterium]|nr:putative lipid II flippase FtsW [Deltaproteobacteria bacterium]